MHLVAVGHRRAARRRRARRGRRSTTCCGYTHVVLSPGPGHPADPADFAVGREVLRAGDRAGARASASACRAWSRRTAGRSSGSRPRTARSRRSATTARGVFAGLPQRLRGGALPLARRRRAARRACVVTAVDEASGRGDGRARTATLPLRGRAVPPRVDPVASTAPRWSRTSWRRRDATRSSAFRRGRRRARPAASGSTAAAPATWSGRRSLVGWLDEDDVSLTYDAAAPRGDPARRRPRRGRSATTSSPCSRRELARDAGDPDVHWVGYFGYACRPDLPGRAPTRTVPDAVWMRPRARRGSFDHPTRRRRRRRRGRAVGRRPHGRDVAAGLVRRRRSPRSRSSCARATPTRST